MSGWIETGVKVDMVLGEYVQETKVYIGIYIGRRPE